MPFEYAVKLEGNIVTDTGSPVTPAGTETVIEFAEADKTFPLIPPKLTADAPEKLVPVIVTVPPVPVVTGVNDVTVGGGI